MPSFKVFEIIGENCITMEDGQKIYELVHPELKAENSVNLDFSGCKIFVSLFFNYAIGHLLKDFSSDDLKRLLTISHIEPVGTEALQRVIENAKRYYSMDDSARKKIDEEILLQTTTD